MPTPPEQLPTPTSKQLAAARAEDKRAAEITRASPDWHTLKRELGRSLVMREGPDGKINARVTGKDALRRLHKLTAEHRKLSSAHGYERHSKVPTVKVRDTATGQLEQIPEAAAIKREAHGSVQAVEQRAPQWTQIDGMWFKVTKKGLIPGEPPSRLVL